MFRALLRLVAVGIFGLFGDLAHLWRVSLCVLLGAAATALIYWLWPTVLPLWPAVLLVVGAVVLGVAWEWRAKEREETMLT